MAYRFRAGFLFVFLFCALAAQADTLLLPPNIILPNYDRTLVGQIPSLEAGAYAARVNDASSNWYNPAGLLHAKKTAINASSSAYQWTGIKASTQTTVTGAKNGGQPPSFFGAVIGEPLTTSDDFRVGFSITNETYWAPSLQSKITSPSSVTPASRTLYATKDSFTETVPAVAVAFRLSDSLRVGLSGGLDIVGFQTNDTASTQTTDAASQTVFSRTAQIDGGSMNFIGSGGLQYDLSDRWKIAAAFKTPSTRLSGNSKVSIENISSGSGTTTDTAFFDPEATFKYFRPFQASVGLAYVTAPFEIEGDIRYHASSGTYSMFSSDQTVTTTSNSGGAPTTTMAPANDVVNQFKSATNYAIGAKFAISDSVAIHGGYFTSESPLQDKNSLVFRRVDLQGFTLGASLTLSHFSGSFGFSYETGKSDPYSVPTSDTGASVPTTVQISALGILYAISFTF